MYHFPKRVAREAAKDYFARQVVRRAQALSMNQADLARASGLTRDAVHTYWSGRSIPEPQNLAALAAALKCAPSDLVLSAPMGDGALPSTCSIEAIPGDTESVRLFIDATVPEPLASDVLRRVMEARRGAVAPRNGGCAQ